MKKKAQNMLRRITGMTLCLSMFATCVPVLALEREKAVELPDTEILEPVKTYPFILEYTAANKKEALLAKLQEMGCTPDLILDFANCVAVDLDMDQLATIKEYTFVESVERNYEYGLLSADRHLEELAGSPPVRENDDNQAAHSDNTSLNNQKDTVQQAEPIEPFKTAHDQNIKGQTIKVAILDTGISAHEDIAVAGGVSFVGDRSSYLDTQGHGTQMAGIIAASGENNDAVKGAAPLAQLYGVKVVDEDGYATTASIMAGINWAIENDMQIINMSFGCYFESKLLEKEIERAARHGIVMVGAVGNDGSFEDEYRIMYPAAYDSVLAVGAGSANGVSSFSNNNERLDFVAPGRLDTTDINGGYTHVVGTSASAAYATGMLAALWSDEPQYHATQIMKTVKNAGVIAENQENYIGYGELSLDEALTELTKNGNVVMDKEELYQSSDAYTAIVEKEAELSPTTENMPAAMAAGNCFANEMANAINLKYFNALTGGRINCPGNEVWYKFTANVAAAHANGQPGWYSIGTQGSLDTVGYLYDSSGNQLAYNDDTAGNTNFHIYIKLTYCQTYYVRVKAHGSNIGNYSIIPSYYEDRNGDSFANATTVNSVYYTDQSIDANLHINQDKDFFKFVPARDCVMEIYTEGSTDTYGTLYNECKVAVTSDNDSGNGDNFKITYHFKAMQYYYIAVQHATTGAGDYNLRFKFNFDCHNTVSGQYNIVVWNNSDNPHGKPNEYIEINKIFITEDAMDSYAVRVIEDYPNYKPKLGSAINEEIQQKMIDTINSIGISFVLPEYDILAFVLDLANSIYDYMQPTTTVENSYKTFWNLINNGQDGYIVGTVSEKTGSTQTKYSLTGPSSREYEGALYQHGDFVKVSLKK